MRYLLLAGWTIGLVASLVMGRWTRALVSAGFIGAFAILWLAPTIYTRAMERQEREWRDRQPRA